MSKKVLVVDDDKSLSDALSEKIKHEGYKVILASNGEEGLKSCLSEKPDCVLLDLMMPVMDGREMLNRLRKDKWGANVPVVILTNASDITSMNNTIGVVNNQSGNPSLNDYFIKSDTTLEMIIELIEEKTSLIH